MQFPYFYSIFSIFFRGRVKFGKLDKPGQQNFSRRKITIAVNPAASNPARFG